MVADVLAKPEVRASVAMVFTLLSWNIPVSATEVLNTDLIHGRKQKCHMADAYRIKPIN